MAGKPRKKAAKSDSTYEMLPFTITIDQREKAPYSFMGVKCDADKANRDLVVPVVTAHLKTGDYSILGLEHLVCVERKSLEDAYNTFIHHRARFEEELERMQGMKYAAVVIEADYNGLLHRPPRHCKANPKSVVRSILAWSQRYPTVHWFPLPGRRLAELFTLRILQRFHKDNIQ